MSGLIERLKSEYDEAIAKAKGWISVEDRMPPSGERVICRTAWHDTVLKWDRRGFWVGMNSMYPLSAVTHWKPMEEK